MSAPYSVSYGYGDGYKKFDDLADAIAFAKSRPTDISVSIIGDDYDVSYDDGPDHAPNIYDGLTDDERERVREAGL